VPFLFGGPSGADPRLGLAIIAMTATMAVMSPIGGWMVERVGSRAVVVGGGVLGALGIIGLMQLPAAASARQVGAWLLLIGLGIGVSTGPAQAVALHAVPPEQSAIASATVSMLRYLGAVAGTVVLGYALAGDAAGVSLGFVIFAIAFVASALLGFLFPRTFTQRT
jgi:MFS transporter, DHA2 family, multidrug resistance protein